MKRENLKSQFIDLLTGNPRIPGLVTLLRSLSIVWSSLLSLRNHLYDKGYFTSVKIDCPIICVGNITLGGTGKTPMTIMLCKFYQSQGKKVGVISRGYGAAPDDPQGYNDEAYLIKAQCPDALIVCDADRVAAANACRQQGAAVIIADDGFSHRRLQRDVNIVMLDKTQPFGFDHVLPGGFLREPLTSLSRVNIFISQQHGLEDEQSKTKALRFSPTATWLNATKVLCSVRHIHSKETINLDGKTVNAACAIANPDQFIQFLSGHGANVENLEAMDDHQQFSSADIERLKALQAQHPLIITAKDEVKLKQHSAELGNTYVADIELKVENFTDPLTLGVLSAPDQLD